MPVARTHACSCQQRAELSNSRPVRSVSLWCAGGSSCTWRREHCPTSHSSPPTVTYLVYAINGGTFANTFVKALAMVLLSGGWTDLVALRQSVGLPVAGWLVDWPAPRLLWHTPTLSINPNTPNSFSPAAPCSPHHVCPHHLPLLLHALHHFLPIRVTDIRNLHRGELPGVDGHGAIHALLVRRPVVCSCVVLLCCSAGLLPLHCCAAALLLWAPSCCGLWVCQQWHDALHCCPLLCCLLPCRWMYSATGGVMAFLCATFVFPITAGQQACIHAMLLLAACLPGCQTGLAAIPFLTSWLVQQAET